MKNILQIYSMSGFHDRENNSRCYGNPSEMSAEEYKEHLLSPQNKMSIQRYMKNFKWRKNSNPRLTKINYYIM